MQYYLILPLDLKRYTYTYHEGLNICPSSIYELKDLKLSFLNQKLAYVHVPDGVEMYRHKVSAVYIDRIIDMTEHPDYHDICLNNVSSHPISLYYIPADWQTKDLCLIAIRHHVFGYITNKTPELCEIAVRHYGYALQRVPHVFQTQELCEIAVRQDGIALAHVLPELMTAQLCMLAVRQNGMALQYVPREFKTYDLCVTAVARTPRAVRFLK